MPTDIENDLRIAREKAAAEAKAAEQAKADEEALDVARAKESEKAAQPSPFLSEYGH